MADEHQLAESDGSTNSGGSNRASLSRDAEQSSASDNPSRCFGDLETVFPMGRHGLRETPDNCMYLCPHKTACLRKAMAGLKGIGVKEEMVERGEKAGLIGFFARWSKKKSLYNEKEEISSGKAKR